jgi:uncharacterized protein
VTEQRTVHWDEGTWFNAPEAVGRAGGELVVTAKQGSDLWRTTSYGFVRDTGHALLIPLPVGAAVEVSFVVDYAEQFDQAGVLVRVDEQTWIKAGVEYCDGAPQIGAVVTRGASDWSTAPVPRWAGSMVTVRASRSGDAVTVRARREEEPWQLVRLAPLDPQAEAAAGPYCCAPSRSGLTVTFTEFAVGAAEQSLH